MNTRPSGDAMTVRFHDGDAAAPKPEKLPAPVGWYLHAADTERHTSRREHCDQPHCRNPIEVVTHRYFRRQGQPIIAEHFWCVQHGDEWAARHGIVIEPVSERTARYLTAAEVADAATVGRECEDPSCHRRPGCVFREDFLMRGVPTYSKHGYCAEHGWLKAVAWRIDIQGTSPEGQSR